jgi:hypothetical protein
MATEITNLTELQAIKDALAGDYELANDIDASATEDWNELIDAGAWNDSTEYSLVANTSHDRVTHGGSAYYCIATNTDKEPGVHADWEDYWVLTTLDIGHCLGFEPIGTLDDGFTGTFDGQENTISNLYINRPATNHVGLFGGIDSAISTIKNVRVGGNVTGKDRIGMLCGYLRTGSVDNCHSTGDVSGASRVGGLAGFTYSTTNKIENSSSSADVVSSSYFVGGFIGAARGTITNCYATGNVVSSSYGVGGFIGGTWDNVLTISNSYATGNVSGISSVGGFGGYIGESAANPVITITNCYARSNIIGDTATDTVGGFTGRMRYSNATISNSYSTGTAVNNGDGNAGGFCGLKDAGTDTNNFWDTETSGQATSAMGTGKTTAQMKDYDTFNDASWDIVLKADHDGEEATALWFIDDGTDYPRLWFEWEAETAGNSIFFGMNF